MVNVGCIIYNPAERRPLLTWLQFVENVKAICTWATLQPQRKDPGQRDTTKNHVMLGGIRQTPGYLQKQPCRLPEETGVQLLCAASYDIWCTDMDTEQTSAEQIGKNVSLN